MRIRLALLCSLSVLLSVSAVSADTWMVQPTGQSFCTGATDHAGRIDGPILIYGGGGHGKALIDLVRSLGAYHIVGILDDGFTPGETVMGLPVLGGGEQLAPLYDGGVRLAIDGWFRCGRLTV